MVKNETYAYKPDYCVHPGEYLEEVLEAREIKKRELSERLGISDTHLRQILHKKVQIKSELALQLERTLGISAHIWNNLNTDYSLSITIQKENKQI